MKLLAELLFIGALAGSLHAQQPAANISQLAERVLVVRNANSPVARALADDYARRRAVTHSLTIACQDSALNSDAETIPFGRFQEAVETPLRTYLLNHPEIDFIVLTKGIPIRIAGAPQGRTTGPLALDSYLASLQYDQWPGAIRIDVTDPNYGTNFHGLAWANRFWNSRQRFSHARFGGYLVTRLDGYTEADARQLSTRSLAAEKALQLPTGSRAKILFDVCPGFGSVEKSGVPHSILPDQLQGSESKIIRESDFAEFNSDMKLAAEILSARRLAVDVDLTDLFVGHQAGLAGYVSWGSNDQKFNPGAYRSLTFAPGALCETAVSTSARTFLPTKGGQSLIVDLVQQGATGAKGYTDEPLLQAVASPSILFERYTKGWTLAESYYAASRLVGWQDIVVGDPLCRNYPENGE
jgi:uncharacterized protein (TIGR03790 family)